MNIEKLLSGMDAIDLLIWNSEVSAVVLGKDSDFVLLDPNHITPEQTAEATRREFRFCGVIGLDRAGKLSLEITTPDPDTVRLMGFAVAQFAAYPKATDPFAVDLDMLWNLPDTRDEGGTN